MMATGHNGRPPITTTKGCTMIIRTAKENREHFIILDTQAARDGRLSFRARGIHTYLMTMADNWEIRVGQLVKETKEGRDAIRKALRELEDAGYLHREQDKTPGGRFGKSRMKLFEIPQTPPDDRGRIFSQRCDSPQTGFQATENQPTVFHPLSKDQRSKGPEALAVGQDLQPIKRSKEQRDDSSRPSRKDRKDRTMDEWSLANLVDLDLFASDGLKEAWARFKAYRTDRARRPLTGEKPAPWTERACLMQKAAVERMLAKHGEAITIAAITKSVDRRWIDIYEPKNPGDKAPAAATMSEEHLKRF